MFYLFNPHRHVKIWLSASADIFLPLINQLRLIQFRQKNPSAELAFIFDATLLSHDAITQCFRFCDQYQIKAYDAQELIKRCASAEEIQLRSLYIDEIQHLDKGGNLGSASDKLRLLSPIYQLGTYTDFDVFLQTEGLPAMIEVQQPLLLHISSYAPHHSSTHEFISVNNDCLIIADERAALPLIREIQRIGIFLTSKQKATNPNQTYLANDIVEPRLQQLMQNLSFQQNAREIRHSLIKLCRRNDTFYRFFIASNELMIKDNHISFPSTAVRPSKIEFDNFASSIRIQLEAILTTSTDSKQICEIQNLLSKNNRDAILDFYRNQSQDQLTRITVIDTLGPQAYMFGLFRGNYFPKKAIDESIRLFSLEHYGLNKHFLSQNTTGLHLSIAEKQTRLKNPGNDLSWMPIGQQHLFSQEEYIVQAVTSLQQAWRRKHPGN